MNYLIALTILIFQANVFKIFVTMIFFIQQTSLHIAASKKFANVVKYLVKEGADVNVKDKQGVSSIDF